MKLSDYYSIFIMWLVSLPFLILCRLYMLVNREEDGSE